MKTPITHPQMSAVRVKSKLQLVRYMTWAEASLPVQFLLKDDSPCGILNLVYQSSHLLLPPSPLKIFRQLAPGTISSTRVSLQNPQAQY